VADKPTVLVLEGCRNFRPADARRLQPIVVRLLPRSVVRAVAGRLEIVVFGSLSSSSIAALTGTLGVKLAAIELVEEPEGSLERLLSTYRRLLASSRFWQAHIIGEAVWRRIGPLGRSLAHLAAVYAKAQEGHLLPACKLLHRLLSRTANATLSADAACLLAELVKVYETSSGNVKRCISLPSHAQPAAEQA